MLQHSTEDREIIGLTMGDLLAELDRVNADLDAAVRASSWNEVQSLGWNACDISQKMVFELKGRYLPGDEKLEKALDLMKQFVGLGEKSLKAASFPKGIASRVHQFIEHVNVRIRNLLDNTQGSVNMVRQPR